MKTEKAIRQDHEFVAQIIRNLPINMDSTTKQLWIEKPKDLADALNKALCPVMGYRNFSEWGRVKIGSRKTSDLLRNSLEDSKSRITTCADELLDQIEFVEEEEEVGVYLATAKDITGEDNPSLDTLHSCLVSKGYKHCPAELAPLFRVKYKDEPKTNSIFVYMMPLKTSDGYKVFALNSKWIYTQECTNETTFDGDTKVLFVKNNLLYSGE